MTDDKNDKSTADGSANTPDGSTDISEEEKARTASLSDGTGNDGDGDENSDTASGGAPE
jgi:hypothetical protein